MSRLRVRKALTLLEVIVAVVMMATVALVGSAIAQTARATVHRTADLIESGTERHAAMHLLRDVALHMRGVQPRVATNTAARVFIGTEEHAAFQSLCPSASGTRETCAVRVESSGDHPRLSMSTSTGTYLIPSHGPVRIRFRSSDERGAVWLTAWSDGLTPPVALALVGASDTVVVRLGPPR